MPETGRRYLAPTAQGTGDGLTVANAAPASARLAMEASLKAAGIADSGLAAEGAPDDVFGEICWRDDLGSYLYTDSIAYRPNGTAHGGISDTRKLRHVNVDGAGEEVTASITWNRETETFTIVGDDQLVDFVGTRTADPRASNHKDRMINIGSTARYIATPEDAFAGNINTRTLVNPGWALTPSKTLVNYGTGAWNAGNDFESPTGAYDHVVWGDGFRWSRFRYLFVIAAGRVMHDASWGALWFENIKSIVRNTEPADIGTLVFDSLHGRGWSQALFRIDYGRDNIITVGDHDLDAEFILGDPNVCVVQLGENELTSGPVGNAFFEKAYVRNLWDATKGATDYYQGDAYVANNTAHNLHLSDIIGDVIGDGLFDSKAYSEDPNRPCVFLENVEARRCKRPGRVHANNQGLYNVVKAIDFTTYHPWGDAHVAFDGGIMVWSNPGGAPAMVDDPDRTGTQATPILVTTADDHVFCTLRGLTYEFNPGTPAVDFYDNTDLYATTTAAELAGAKQVRIQQVSGAEPAITIEVDGVEYDGSTLEAVATETNEIAVTGATSDTVSIRVIPAGAAALEATGAASVNATWEDPT